jgi:cytochrome oxidase assembly protein ShyY1
MFIDASDAFTSLLYMSVTSLLLIVGNQKLPQWTDSQKSQNVVHSSSSWHVRMNRNTDRQTDRRPDMRTDMIGHACVCKKNAKNHLTHLSPAHKSDDLIRNRIGPTFFSHAVLTFSPSLLSSVCKHYTNSRPKHISYHITWSSVIPFSYITYIYFILWRDFICRIICCTAYGMKYEIHHERQTEI